jgi:hypothetical protein
VTLLAVLLGLLLYTAQLAGAWVDQENEAHEALSRANSSVAWRVPQTVALVGQGVAAGSHGNLRFNPYDPIGVLQLQDMPVLPLSKAYQLWCVDRAGKVDAASSFTIAMDGDAETVVMISAPRLFGAYVRCIITIEPSGGSSQPTGPTVMST